MNETICSLNLQTRRKGETNCTLFVCVCFSLCECVQVWCQKVLELQRLFLTLINARAGSNTSKTQLELHFTGYGLVVC